LREAATPEPEIAKPAEAAGLHTGEPGNLIPWQDEISRNRRLKQALILATGDVCPNPAASGRVLPHPGGTDLFAIIAVPFDAFQALPRSEHRWLLTCLSRYADRAGACWPPMRQLAADARMSLSTVSRRLKEMADLSVFQRERKGVGRYVYRLAEAYRPRWPGRDPGRVSAVEHRVSQGETPEQVEPEKHQRGAPACRRFAKSGISYGELPDERIKWEARLRSWRQSRFWLPLWGPKPTEPGCFAPVVPQFEI
jgi:hypothetical protein